MNQMKTTRINRWRSPASEYPRKRVGSAAIKTAWYSPGMYENYMRRDFQYFYATRRLYITILQIDGKTWMVDDPPHWWAMQQHSSEFHGHVLCAGLGLGLIVHALNANSLVDRVTVVERSEDVIKLVEPLIPDKKLTIIHSDWDDVQPDQMPKVDCVLYDLFVGNAHELFYNAVQEVVKILTKWRGDDPKVRVHGFMNPTIAACAHAEIAARESGFYEKLKEFGNMVQS